MWLAATGVYLAALPQPMLERKWRTIRRTTSSGVTRA
jgi:hypothetical protein